jgi:ABC-2 type transport system permease protein
MAKLWAIVKREYLERVRSKWFVIATMFGPVIMGALVIVPAYITAKSKSTEAIYNTRILDATNSGVGDRISLAIVGNNPRAKVRPNVLVVPPSALSQAESTATHDIMQRRLNGYLVLDQQTLAGEKARYAGRSATSIPDMERLRSAIRQTIVAMRLERAGVNRDSVEELTFMPLSLSSERITDKGRGGSGTVSIIFAAAIAFLLYMSIVLYGQNVLRGVLEEKTNRVAEVVVSSVPPETLLAGKVIGVGGVGLTQQVIWAITTFMMMKARAPIMERMGLTAAPFSMPDIGWGTGVLLVVFFVLGFTFYAALYAAAGSAVNTEQEAQQVVQPLILMLVGTAVFIQPILVNPSSRMAQIMSWMPFSAPIIMPLRLSMTSVSPLEIALTLVGLLAACFAAVWVASRIYRVGLLMYGKKPTLREMARWVSYSR